MGVPESAKQKAMLNADPQRNTAFERMKSSIAEAMQPGMPPISLRLLSTTLSNTGMYAGDAKSTLRRLPPDEQEAILPIEEDEKPLYGQRQSTEINGGAGPSARASAAGAVVGAGVGAGVGADIGPGATTSKKDQGMMASAGEMVGKALGRK
jgi:hypothetical protein